MANLAETRHREVDESYTQTLVNSMTIDQLRTAVATFGRGAHPLGSKQEVCEALFAVGGSNAEIERVLLDIESRTPPKHCLVMRAQTAAAPRFADLPASIWCEDVKVEFRRVYTLTQKKFSSVTFEHHVHVDEWRAVDNNTKKRDVRIVRHPVIFRTYADLPVLLVGFPGFSGGSSDGELGNLNYEALIQSLTQAVARSMRMNVSALPIDQSLGILQSADSGRIRIVRSDMEAAKGRVSLSSDAGKESVDDLLVNLISPHMARSDVRKLQSAVASAVRNAQKNYVVAYWKDEKIFTRIKFWMMGAEFLFVWGRGSQTFSAIKRILDIIVNVSSQIAEPTRLSLWQKIAELKSGEVVLPESLAAAGYAQEEVKSALLEAVRAAILEAVFRIRAEEMLVDISNEWTADASSLKRIFLTSSGKIVDGRDLTRVEVAFRKRGDSA